MSINPKLHDWWVHTARCFDVFRQLPCLSGRSLFTFHLRLARTGATSRLVSPAGATAEKVHRRVVDEVPNAAANEAIGALILGDPGRVGMSEEGPKHVWN